jgi:hypothetical protein
MQLKAWHWQPVLFVFASPVLFILAVYRMVRRFRFARVTRQPSLECRTCGVQIMLLGFWRCRCGFTYEGHLLRSCPICGSFPAMVRCTRCGATEKVGV